MEIQYTDTSESYKRPFYFNKELKYLKHEIKNPQRPLAVIMGGAKIKGKIELIEKFLDISDYLLIGGALSFPFLKIEGIDIESSLMDKESLQNAKKLLDYEPKFSIEDGILNFVEWFKKYYNY